MEIIGERIDKKRVGGNIVVLGIVKSALLDVAKSNNRLRRGGAVKNIFPHEDTVGDHRVGILVVVDPIAHTTGNIGVEYATGNDR